MFTLKLSVCYVTWLILLHLKIQKKITAASLSHSTPPYSTQENMTLIIGVGIASLVLVIIVFAVILKWYQGRMQRTHARFLAPDDNFTVGDILKILFL